MFLQVTRCLGKLALGLVIFWISWVLKSIVDKIGNGILRLTTQLLFFGLVIAVFILLGRFFFKSRKLNKVKFNVSPMIIFLKYFTIFNLFWIVIIFLNNTNYRTFLESINRIYSDITLDKIVGLMMVAIFEEVFARYYLISSIVSENFNIYIAILVSSFTFAIIHSNNYSTGIWLPIILGGIAFAQLFILTKSLIPPIALHFTNNMYVVHRADPTVCGSIFDGLYAFQCLLYCFVIFTIIWIIKNPKTKDVIAIYLSNNQQ